MTEDVSRKVAFLGDTQKVIDDWPEDVRDIVKTNLEALQLSRRSAFCNLPDWAEYTKVADKGLSGGKLNGARQLTIKDKKSYRVVYIADYQDVVVVLHSFTKQKEGRQKKDMDTVEIRLKFARKTFGTP